MRSALTSTAVWRQEVVERRDDLARGIWDVDDLTSLVARYAGMTLEHKLDVNELHEPSTVERQQLRLRDATLRVLAREGVTQAAIHAAVPLVFVSFRAVVALHRMPDPVRRALLRGEMGLGAALRPYGVRRHANTVEPVSDVDDRGQQMLLVRAALSLPGRGPVALVEETLYRSALGRP